MTLVEIFVFAAAVAFLYFSLSPLRKRLESYLYRFFRSRIRGHGPVIDITDYAKKDKQK